MSRVVVVGAGIAGLGTALALARSGHEVALYERDAAGPPATAAAMWAAWPRPGTPQAHHLHAFPGRVRKLLRERAPDVLRQLLAIGAREVAGRAPDGSTEPGDEDLVLLLCRRPVFEGVLRRAVEREPGVRVHPGGVAGGLLTRHSRRAGVPRIVGVRTAAGEDVRAEVVVDASGRRSRVLAWLAAGGPAARG